MSSDLKTFAKGITSGYAFTAISLLVSLWLVPFTLGFLTKPEYGVFAILTDLLGWLAMANLGITATYNSQAAQLLGKKDFNELSIVSSTTFFSQLFSVLLILFLGVFFVFKPEYIVPVQNTSENIQIVIGILVLNFAIMYLCQPFSLLLVADKQIHIDNYIKFGMLFLKTIITVVLFIQGFKLMSLAISSIIATSIFSLISFIRVKNSLPQVVFSIKLWQKNSFAFLLKNGIWFSLGGIAGLLIFRMDSYLIGKFINLEMVASYVITIKLYQIGEMVHQQFFNTTRPYFAQTYGEKNFVKLRKMYNIIFHTSFISAFIIGITILLLNQWFIGFWVGSSFYLGDTLNMLLCINFIIQIAVLPNRILLATSLYKIEIHNITRIFEGVLKYGLCFFLIVSYGINSIVCIGIICSLLLSNISLNILTSRLLNESFVAKLIPFVFLFGIPLLQLFTFGILKIVLFVLLICLNIVFVFYFYFKKDDFLFIKNIFLKKGFNS